MNKRLSFYSLFLLTIFLFTLTNSCASPPPTESLPAIPNVIYRATETPFQPQNGDDSPYTAPTATITPGKPPEAIGTLLMEQSNRPTPLPFIPGTGATAFAPSLSINPLTGLPASNPELLERRPMAVKITLFPRYVRPESGLSLADIVFEYYIEAGLTRFIAVYYGNDTEKAGPVRSGRFFDEHIARMYHAFFIFKYADARVYDYLKGSDLYKFLVVPGSGACPPFVVGKQARDTYNNVFFNTVKFKDCIAKREGVDNVRPPLRGGFFGELPPKSDGDATRINIKYSIYDYSYWDYLPNENRYQRFQETTDLAEGKEPAYAPLSDAETGEYIKTDNVVVLFVSHRFANKFDQEDEVYHIDLFGSGDAYVFRDGIAAKATWQRTNLDQPLLLTNENGTPIYLKPGRTFYQIIGASSTVEQKGSKWYFEFNAPP